MNTKRPIRLIKNEEGKEPEAQAEVAPAADPNKWSTEVRSWIVEFQQQRVVESLPAFDSLFKEVLPESGNKE